MPAIDQCHQRIVHALQKQGWQIDPKPLTLDLPTRHLFVDIVARRINADEHEQIIVIEAKCFSNPNTQIHNLYVAVGQYLTYRSLLAQTNLNFPIYLAIPSHAYHGILKEIGMGLVQEVRLKLIVINLQAEAIEEWLE